MIGSKTGGRVAGTPNRKTSDVADLLASLDFDPIRGMVEIARNAEASLELRGRMNAELAHYIYPKRKAVEHSAPEGASALSEIRVTFVRAIEGRPAGGSHA